MLICRNNVFKEVTDEKFERVYKGLGFEVVKRPQRVNKTSNKK